jgi:hypothetical protein
MVLSPKLWTIVWDGSYKQGGPQQCCQTQGGTLETIQPFPLPQQRRLMFLYFFYCGLDNQLVFLVRVLGSVNKSQRTGKLSKYPKIIYHPVIHRTLWLIAWMASKHSMDMILFVFVTKCIYVHFLKRIKNELSQSQGEEKVKNQCEYWCPAINFVVILFTQFDLTNTGKCCLPSVLKISSLILSTTSLHRLAAHTISGARASKLYTQTFYVEHESNSMSS